jgi:hypothetical protein
MTVAIATDVREVKSALRRLMLAYDSSLFGKRLREKKPSLCWRDSAHQTQDYHRAATESIGHYWLNDDSSTAKTKELSARSSRFSRLFGWLFFRGSCGSSLAAFNGLALLNYLAAAVAAVAAATVAAVSTTTVATTAVTSVAATAIAPVAASAVAPFVTAMMLPATTGITTRIATTVAAAFASWLGFAAFGFLLAALGLAAGLAAGLVMVLAMMMMTETSAKASAATMAGFRLRLQTHENHGECR